MNHDTNVMRDYFFPPAIIDGVLHVKLNNGEPISLRAEFVATLHEAVDCCGGPGECWVEMIDGRTFRTMHPRADVFDLYEQWRRDR